MKIFIDTANLADIEDALKRGLIDGITTNPSLLAKEPKAKFEDHIQKIIDLVYKWRGTSPMSISVEVFSRDPDEILKQAREFQRRFNYPALSVKIHIGWNELGLIRMLSQQGVSVNCTACMTPTQALMAAAAGARYVSLFWGRIRDSGDKSKPTWPAIEKMLLSGDLHADDLDPAKVMAKTRELIEQRHINSEIIAGSMRSKEDVKNAMLAGAHIVTVPPKFFPDLPAILSHPKTDEVVDQFMKDFEGWLK